MRIKELRKQHKVLQIELGRALGIAPNTLSQYENGKREPDLDTIRKMSEYFGVSVGYLLGTENEKNPTPVTEGGTTDPIIAQIMDIVRQLPPETQIRSLEHFESLLALQKSAQAPNAHD